MCIHKELRQFREDTKNIYFVQNIAEKYEKCELPSSLMRKYPKLKEKVDKLKLFKISNYTIMVTGIVYTFIYPQD